MDFQISVHQRQGKSKSDVGDRMGRQVLSSQIQPHGCQGFKMKGQNGKVGSVFPNTTTWVSGIQDESSKPEVWLCWFFGSGGQSQSQKAGFNPPASLFPFLDRNKIGHYSIIVC